MKITGNIVPSFTLQEMACNDKDETLIITPELVAHAKRVQKLRAWYNRSMPVASWYRTPEYNKTCGGEPNSYHMFGVATDIELPVEFYKFSKSRQNDFLNNIASQWFKICQEDGIGGGFGKYNTFFHIDSGAGAKRNATSLVMWDERTR